LSFSHSSSGRRSMPARRRPMILKETDISVLRVAWLRSRPRAVGAAVYPLNSSCSLRGVPTEAKNYLTTRYFREHAADTWRSSVIVLGGRDHVPQSGCWTSSWHCPSLHARNPLCVGPPLSFPAPTGVCPSAAPCLSNPRCRLGCCSGGFVQARCHSVATPPTGDLVTRVHLGTGIPAVG